MPSDLAKFLRVTLRNRNTARMVGAYTVGHEYTDMVREVASKLIGAGITVSPSPTEVKAPASVVAHPVGAGRGEGTRLSRDMVSRAYHQLINATGDANRSRSPYSFVRSRREVRFLGDQAPAPAPVKRRRKPKPSDQLPLFARQRVAERFALLGAS